MNRIKEALEAGKAIHCRTEDEARRLFEVVGWDIEQGIGMMCLFHEHGKTVFGALNDPYHINEWWAGYENDYPNAVPFSTLARSPLAEALGVEDGQEFTYGGASFKYTVGSDGRVWYLDIPGWRVYDNGCFIADMINHPEEIIPCPVWSEEEIAQARVCENLFGYNKVWKNTTGTTATIGTGCWGKEMAGDKWPNVQPGQTVKLSEIKQCPIAGLGGSNGPETD